MSLIVILIALMLLAPAAYTHAMAAYYRRKLAKLNAIMLEHKPYHFKGNNPHTKD